MNGKEDTVFCYYSHNSVWTCELGYGADTMFHRTYFLFTIPFCRLSLGNRALNINVPRVWNNPTYDCLASSSIACFKRNLKTELFNVRSLSGLVPVPAFLICLRYTALYKFAFDLKWLCSKGGWVTLSATLRGNGASPANDCWRQKTRVLWLLRGIVCLILRVTIWTQYRHMTDRHTTTANTRAR